MITVGLRNAGLTPASLLGPARIEILIPADSATVRPPFRVQVRLLKECPGRKPEVMNFTAGQTDIRLNPPADDYTLHLAPAGATEPAGLMARADALRLTVVSR